jgi:hypothetical protein
MKRWDAGGMARSELETRYQLGIDAHDGGPEGSRFAAKAIGGRACRRRWRR